jgi:hypothetical protein
MSGQGMTAGEPERLAGLRGKTNPESDLREMILTARREARKFARKMNNG